MPTHEFEMPTLQDSMPMEPEEHSVTLPVSKEIADLLTVGERAEVKFYGIVKEIDSGYSAEDDYSIRVAIKRITVEPDNEFTDLSRDDDE
jgi:hypothetical protein